MSPQEFNEILDFAVEREKEAVRFYHELQTNAKFKAQQEMLKELEAMETGHIIVIENLRAKGIAETDIPKVQNLKISEYITADIDEADLNYQNILIRAMKREETAFKLYSELSVKFGDGNVAMLFRKLASEEAKHKLIFEKLYDEWITAGN